MSAKAVWWLCLGLLLGAAMPGSAGAQAQAPCPPGSQWSPRLQRCVVSQPACPPGAEWSPRLRRCVSPGKKCPQGMVWVPGQGCRPVPPPPPKPRRGEVVPPPPAEPRYYAEPSDLPAPGALLMVRASALNLRDCSGRRCQARAVLEAGQSVQYLDYRNGYALVRVIDSNLEGWVDFRYLAPLP